MYVPSVGRWDYNQVFIVDLTGHCSSQNENLAVCDLAHSGTWYFLANGRPGRTDFGSSSLQRGCRSVILGARKEKPRFRDTGGVATEVAMK